MQGMLFSYESAGERLLYCGEAQLVPVRIVRAFWVICGTVGATKLAPAPLIDHTATLLHPRLSVCHCDSHLSLSLSLHASLSLRLSLSLRASVTLSLSRSLVFWLRDL